MGLFYDAEDNCFGAIFGLGDVGIGMPTKDSPYNDIFLVQREEGEIGTLEKTGRYSDDKTIDKVEPKILLSFQNQESLDALISSLQKLKERFVVK